MKKFYLVLALSGIMQMGFGQAVDKSVDIPDLDNYQTLKCDFHMHTVFSDGLVWPTVRVDEAYAEGLDAIAITEHLEYRPHKADIQADHNRSYEIMKKYAKDKGVIVIKGSEITRSMARDIITPSLFRTAIRWTPKNIRMLSVLPSRRGVHLLESSGMGFTAAGRNQMVGRTYILV